MFDGLSSRRQSGSGRGGYTRAGSAWFLEAQRRRICSAAYEIALERGYAGMSVGPIVARAGVSRKTFYDCFTGAEDCYMAVLEKALADIAQVVVPAFQTPGRWSERLRSALGALLMFLDDEPALASLLLLDAPALAAPSVLDWRSRVLERLMAAIEEGAGQAPATRSLPSLTAEALVGGALAVVQARAGRRPRQRLSGLTSPVMSMLVLPYLGPAVAATEHARPAPRPPRAPRRPLASRTARSSLESLEIRLTYRTLRTLAAIAARPDASNREIAAAAAISDRGQVSKLLARLQAHGLVRNTAEAKPSGPNAWRLTSLGEELGSAIGPMRPVANGRRRAG
jgi:AcrR family transcriptional regulator/DNA-binding HxlR family transcriptional regulator